MQDPPAGSPGSGSPPYPASLVAGVTQLAATRPHEPAYTFMDYSATLAGSARILTWAALDRSARAVAAALRGRAGPGDRAAVLAPQGLGYVVAMLGAFYARVTAVPLFTPDLPGHRDRLDRIIADADPACVLTTADAAAAVGAFLRERPAGSLRDVLTVGAIGQGRPPPRWQGPPLPRAGQPDPGPHSEPGRGSELAAGWAGGPPAGRAGERPAGWEYEPEPIGADEVAYLQYTSGSTRLPTGVMITHGCLVANAAQIDAALTVAPGTATALGWLPLFHDMGFVMTIAMPIATANRSVFMDPAAFLMRPVRWLELASRYPGVITAGPNFAYEYCAARIGADAKTGLDLGGVRAFLNGAEPVRPATVRTFIAAFADCGLRPQTMTPAYGLAEATVYVASGQPGDAVHIVAFDRQALELGRAHQVPEDSDGAISLASCGTPGGQHVLIVDPQTRRECPAGQVGEIWVHGPNVAPGYFRQPPGEGEVFAAALAAAPDGLPAEGWLRTGDLGVFDGGELFVTGRLKDLIIIDGRNHYPQDVEVTAQNAHPVIRRDRVAAFAVPGSDRDHVVVVAERARRVAAGHVDPVEVARAVRGAVSARHDLRLHDFLLVEPGMVPRTSSGKIARSASRERYLAGTFAPGR
jgi:acyl-CoA synthetase (AMP-forming)/AMP-acid ligase II